ncbi:hypothetical protein TWF225_007704 [Orbilia oligospora]|uniref:Uncharacterized protein n=1 Tax=Orbilia oligospora TaxID=2813651 RepID=A0A7C8JXS3_ORBOL|nr:hypothetical protein TWF751_005514 [Orbilia oligospora]KAF3179180.1 hypothetical protein TWF225_007704 [Orbilia oligospora]KAF3230933.1 hypothetical protein TWF128_005083 [Orbilia oligospora]KAF3246772.1 hypothetical protein TWF217_009800 [Orbilia oligospora]KAF3285731.1 hypothetical protein TWF132_009236 [Orbilia oligospora]
MHCMTLGGEDEDEVPVSLATCVLDNINSFTLQSLRAPSKPPPPPPNKSILYARTAACNPDNRARGLKLSTSTASLTDGRSGVRELIKISAAPLRIGTLVSSSICFFFDQNNRQADRQTNRQTYLQT